MITPSDITVISPYGGDGELGKALNRAVETASTEWVLLHDDDVLLKLNPNWRAICAAALNAHPNAGLFYPWTSALMASDTTERNQIVPKGAPDPLDTIRKHIEFARGIWDRYGWSVTEIPDAQIGGAVHLTSRSAWVAAGGYPGVGMFGEDHAYCRALTATGYKIYRIDGLYTYHLGSGKGHREPSWIDGEKASRELHKDERARRKTT